MPADPAPRRVAQSAPRPEALCWEPKGPKGRKEPKGPRRAGGSDLHHLAHLINAVGWELEEVGGILGVFAEKHEELLAPFAHPRFGGDRDPLLADKEGGLFSP